MSTCQHRNTTFSRDICPEPCAVMHTSCDDCYALLDECAHDPANWTTEQAQAAQAELDDLERTDPDVAAAAASYDRMVEKMTGRRVRAEHEPTDQQWALASEIAIGRRNPFGGSTLRDSFSDRDVIAQVLAAEAAAIHARYEQVAAQLVEAGRATDVGIVKSVLLSSAEAIRREVSR